MSLQPYSKLWATSGSAARMLPTTTCCQKSRPSAEGPASAAPSKSSSSKTESTSSRNTKRTLRTPKWETCKVAKKRETVLDCTPWASLRLRTSSRNRRRCRLRKRWERRRSGVALARLPKVFATRKRRTGCEDLFFFFFWDILF